MRTIMLLSLLLLHGMLTACNQSAQCSHAFSASLDAKRSLDHSPSARELITSLADESRSCGLAVEHNARLNFSATYHEPGRPNSYYQLFVMAEDHLDEGIVQFQLFSFSTTETASAHAQRHSRLLKRVFEQQFANNAQPGAAGSLPASMRAAATPLPISD